MRNSNKKVITGFLWNFGEKILIQLISFVVGIFLARKLGPSTYGLVATVSTIITVINIASNLYIGTYLMRKKEVDSLDMNTAFYFDLFVHVVLYFILFLISPLLAKLYNEPQITTLLRVMGISLLFSSFMGIKMVIIVRNYQYMKFFFISFIGTLIAGVVGVVFAYKGFGVWALVAQHCLDCVIDTIFLWTFVKWLPKFEFSFSRLKQMIKYGFPLWFFGIADAASTRTQALIIGKRYTSADLAFYNRGESFPSMIEANSTSALNNVLLRRVSEEQDDSSAVKILIDKITKISLYISVPAMFGLAAVSTTLIEILLGSDWLPSVVFVELFCLAFALKPIEATSDIALKAVGKTKQFFVFGFIKKSLFIVSIVCSVPFGVKAIAIGFLFASIFACMVSLIANKICFKLSIWFQIENVFLPFLISSIMWIFVSRMGLLMGDISLIVSLLVQVLSGIFIYVFFLIGIDRKAVLYFKSLINSLFKRDKAGKEE